jgi:hypothetical protein
MTGLLASLALIGGFLALVVVLVIAIKLVIFYMDRLDGRRLLALRHQGEVAEGREPLAGSASDRRRHRD